MKVLDHVLVLLAFSVASGCGDDPTSSPAAPEPDPEPRQPTALVCAPAPANLVAWWPGDGTAEDIAGDAHGTVAGGATFVPGYVGEAFDLGGAGSAIPVDDPSGGIQFTIEGWLQPRSAAGREALYGTFFSGLVLREGRLTWWQDDNAGSDPGSAVKCLGERRCDYFRGEKQLENGTWQHIALAYDAAEFRSYVDGQLDATGEFVGGRLTGGQSSPGLGLFARSDFPFWYDGLIDELSIYSRALGASEIEAIWDAGSKGKCRP